MIENKKLLIVGGSYLQLPAIIKAKEMGMKVAVADYNQNAIGVSYADKYYNVSTIDENGIYEAAKDFCADGVITLATDMPMRAVAYACEKLGLNSISYDTAIKSTNKGEMIKAFEAHGVTHPWYYILQEVEQLDSIESKLTYPCISKPIDSSGSRGVVLIKCPQELRKSISYSLKHSPKTGVIIEEYMNGKEVSVEIVVVNEIVHILAVTDKLTTGAPHFVETRHTQPSRLGKENIENIKDLAVKAVLAVGINNGPAHVEIMFTNEGPKLIELGARMGGDFISTHLVPLSTGVDMMKAVITLACGEEVDLKTKFKKGSAIQYITGDVGFIKKIDGLGLASQIDGVNEIKMLKNIGDQSRGVFNSHDRLGYVISQGSTVYTAMNTCEKALSAISIEIE
ncbi:ATP-grasp domain-containing protein [Cytobacillus horneckiae]|uniref:ATP-grasp domain-containing protein n=1 Tax=Cytobacillus horneckiae TaxID=549687 RepID=UPI00204252DD|nr:ATP-grasp domain-containing protein [Cytobacillus horneckiae]MCM3179151.1 ATP-grasp domain-containing protein [Cytobacillus horneckiae]